MEEDMKIKLAILDKDMRYLKRIAAVFSTKYTENVEVYSFTDLEMALSVLNSAKIDILLANEEFDVDFSDLPQRCGFAYLVDAPNVSTLNEQAAVCKFQKPELIYKQILGIYAEKAAGMSGHVFKEGAAKVFSFSSPAGGVGASTLAAACAVYFASQGQRCLYLNLEPFGLADLFFSGEGQYNLSDVIFALKSRKSNFPIKLESCVKRSPQGVYFYAHPKVALDILELTEEETIQLIETLRLTGGYDYIILDAGFDMSERNRNIHRQAQAMVWVSDGSEPANSKICRAYESLGICEANKDAPLTERLCLIYNRYNGSTCQMIEGIQVKTIGGAQRFENRTVEQIVSELSRLAIYGSLDQK